VQLTNAGPSDCQGPILLSDTLPSSLALVSAAPTSGAPATVTATMASNSVTATVNGPLVVGASFVMTITALELPASTQNGNSISNVVTIMSAGTTDPSLANNAATATVGIVCEPARQLQGPYEFRSLLGLGFSVDISFSGLVVAAPVIPSVPAGALPDGISAAVPAGQSLLRLSGVPARSGLFQFSLAVTDASGCQAQQQQYKFVVFAPEMYAAADVGQGTGLSNGGIAGVVIGSCALLALATWLGYALGQFLYAL
jgi:hypothetical protein